MKRLVGLVVLSVLVSLTATVLAFWAATRRQPEGGRG
jgi:Bacterial signalling protein N terminal repeat